MIWLIATIELRPYVLIFLGRLSRTIAIINFGVRNDDGLFTVLTYTRLAVANGVRSTNGFPLRPLSLTSTPTGGGRENLGSAASLPWIPLSFTFLARELHRWRCWPPSPLYRRAASSSACSDTFRNSSRNRAYG